MSDMICENCGRVGIRWMGPFSNLTHTECPHCGGRNCQIAVPEPCAECGQELADPPSSLCPGCDAYRDHTGAM